MAGTLSPDPANLQKQRAPMASWLQSPPSPFMLGSNDDQLERAQARAARAAAIRRMSIQAANAPPIYGDSEPNDCLGRHQILELFQNCIKLASENKINQKNTWELNLIDHLTEIIKVEDEKDAETNFQKASCTLEAGVKIYSLRVDSVHSEAYKVLGGMNRAGQDEDQDTLVEDANAESVPAVNSKKETNRKISPLSTLESSFEALNLKKIDVAFAVDPLYHQTTAQFDEGGAKGLLLNNLGVYGKCRVLFDSLEVPGKCVSCDDDRLNKSDRIDLSFAKECIEEMVMNMRMKHEISPTLRSIVERFDEENRRPSTFYSSAEKSEESEVYNDGIGSDGEPIGNCGNWDCDQDHDDVPTMFDGGLHCADSSFANCVEENEPCSADDPDTGDIFDKVDGYLILSLGLTSKRNSWAGPDHWKYRKTKVHVVGSEVDPPENESQLTTKRKRNKKQAEAEINFTEALDKEMLDIFSPPKNPKSLLLPASRPHCNIKLPEDCHYHPEDLVKLFLLPKIKCLGRRGRKSSDESMQKFDDYGQLPSWDDESELDGLFDEAVVHNDVEDSSNLVSQPRQVNKIEVQYDKTSKQVDVQVLKETLWDCMQESNRVSIQEQEDSISFKQLLASFPRDCRADVTTNDISPHLCFICLLHLANEHGLSIHGHTNLDDLTVHLSL